MSDLGAISRPYAEAVFSLAKDKGEFDKWQNALELVNELANNSEVNLVLNNPTVEKSAKKSLITALVEKAGGDDNIKRYAEILVDNERLEASSAILNRFQALKHEVDNELEVLVETALDIDENKQKELATSLEKRFGKKITLATKINKDLIGGTIVHAGDTVIDDSVKGKLERLSNSLQQ